MSEKEDIITKTYDLLLYLMPQLSKYPRTHKFMLADRIGNLLLDFLEDMIQAYYGKEKIGFIDRGNLRLERLRFLIRLSKDLQCISIDKYRLVSEKMDEIGRMAGGWKKSLMSRS